MNASARDTHYKPQQLPDRIVSCRLTGVRGRVAITHLRGVDSHAALCGATPAASTTWLQVAASPGCGKCIDRLNLRNKRLEKRAEREQRKALEAKPAPIPPKTWICLVAEEGRRYLWTVTLTGTQDTIKRMLQFGRKPIEIDFEEVFSS